MRVPLSPPRHINEGYCTLFDDNKKYKKNKYYNSSSSSLLSVFCEL